MNGGKIAPCNLFAAHIFNHKNVFIWVKKKEHMNAFKKRMQGSLGGVTGGMTGTEKPKEEIQFPYMLEDDGFEMGATEGEGGRKKQTSQVM